MRRILLVILLLILAGGVATWTELRPYAEPVLSWLSSLSAGRQGPLPQNVYSERVIIFEATLSSALARLEFAEQRLALIEKELQSTRLRAQEQAKEASSKSLPTSLPDKPREMKPLEVKASEDTKPTNPTIVDKEKSDSLLQRQGEHMAKGPLLLLAVRQLREAVDRGTAFATEFKTVISLGDVRFNPALELLAPLAQTGIPTRAVLAERFKLNATAALAANSHTDSNWLEGRVSQLFSSAITVRKKGGRDNGNAEAIKRAEKLMVDGDLIGCSEALNLIEGPAVAVMQPWMQAARTRIKADKMLSEILSLSIVTANESGE
jgi:hypothetical protein